MSMSGWEEVLAPAPDQRCRDQMHLDVPSFVARAVAVGLNVERLEAELLGDAHLDRFQEHLLTGVRSGVQGTPTSFVNGIRYDGPHDPASLLTAVEQAAHARA